MSSIETPGGAAAAQRYFCHQCERIVTLTPSLGAEICPICHGDFLKEFDPNPNPSPHSSSFQSTDPFFPFHSPISLLFSPSSAPSTSSDLLNPSDLAGLFEPDLFRSLAPTSGGSSGPEPFNPLVFLQNHIKHVLSNHANIQIVIEGGPGFGGNLGNYFIGLGLK